MSDDNTRSDDRDEAEDWSGGGGGGGNAKRLPGAERLGASVYELGLGNFIPHHFHHGAEEMFVARDGAMTIKTEGPRLWLIHDVPKQPE